MIGFVPGGVPFFGTSTRDFVTRCALTNCFSCVTINILLRDLFHQLELHSSGLLPNEPYSTGRSHCELVQTVLPMASCR